MASKVVIVEAPSKAKTLGKYLGSEYVVLASYGHVRDLPSKKGSVLPDQDFSLVWEISPSGEKHLKDIARAVRLADEVYLATDPDREGEAIAWHVMDVLNEMLPKKNRPVFKRAVFYEVTRQAVLKAIANPRDLDQDLIDACLARRTLDYLVGFTLSPILWRKLPGSRSAGRVQSVVLKLMTDREKEIEAFRSREYWTLEGRFQKEKALFSARLDWFEGQKTEKFSIPDASTCEAWAFKIQECGDYRVAHIERTQVRRHPSAPFTTSTLQQEASRRLGFGVSKTMQIAQQLYEGVDLAGETVGLITYMRTDSVQLSTDAIQSVRSWVDETWGKDYVPDQPKTYKSKQKNAQEAHEGIRPTLVSRHPDTLLSKLSPDAWKLYDLIWKRTVASQMTSAVFDQMAVDLRDATNLMGFRATGSRLIFDGFLKLYRDAQEEDTEETPDTMPLPALEVGDILVLDTLKSDQHFTQPPPRYTEASIVKKMEELGIGRPSTYVSTLQVLKDRKYVKLESKRFIPEGRGRLVTTFLENYFKTYVEYGFTADLEEKLDHISSGQQPWKNVLRDFWEAFFAAAQETQNLRITEVLDVIERELEHVLFPVSEDASESAHVRQCPQCSEGRLSLKLGKFGAFIGCSRYPECGYTRPLSPLEAEQEAAQKIEVPDLGQDPVTGLPIFLKKGPYGFYVQRGTAAPDLKRAPVPRFIAPSTVGLKQALDLLTLPRQVGLHPETQDPIHVGVGRYGPYIKYQSKFHKLPEPDTLLTLTLSEACDVLAHVKPSPDKEDSSKKSVRKIVKKTPKNSKTTQKTGSKRLSKARAMTKK